MVRMRNGLNLGRSLAFWKVRLILKRVSQHTHKTEPGTFLFCFLPLAVMEFSLVSLSCVMSPHGKEGSPEVWRLGARLTFQRAVRSLPGIHRLSLFSYHAGQPVSSGPWMPAPASLLSCFPHTEKQFLGCLFFCDKVAFFVLKF